MFFEFDTIFQLSDSWKRPRKKDRQKVNYNLSFNLTNLNIFRFFFWKRISDNTHTQIV